jgi:hypothetical protein
MGNPNMQEREPEPEIKLTLAQAREVRPCVILTI